MEDAPARPLRPIVALDASGRGIARVRLRGGSDRATLNVGNAILGLTALSFLGVGVQAPQAEWGAMINTAQGSFDTHPWVMVAPGLANNSTVLAVNILGDAIRDATDPRRPR